LESQPPEPAGETQNNTPVQANPARKKKLARLGIPLVLLGLLLFAYFVRKAGVSLIFENIKRLGAGFILIIAISSIRHTVRSLAWTKCFESPYRLRFRDAFAARLMGDAIGNIIPLASVAVSEPSKAALVTNRVPLMASLSALALENIFYSLSVVLFIFSGTTALMLSFSLPKPLRIASAVALAVTFLIVPFGYFIIRKQLKFLSGSMSFLAQRGIARAWMTNKGVPRASTLEERIYGFYSRNRGRLIPIFLLEVCFHLTGVTEIFVTLSFISDVRPTLLTAFILESVNRIINVVFKFMPLRAGFDEGGTEMLAKILGFARNIGVTLAIVRKGRDIFWAAVGVALLTRRGFSFSSLKKPDEADVKLAEASRS
jgi:hypothetical protein